MDGGAAVTLVRHAVTTTAATIANALEPPLHAVATAIATIADTVMSAAAAGCAACIAIAVACGGVMGAALRAAKSVISVPSHKKRKTNGCTLTLNLNPKP